MRHLRPLALWALATVTLAAGLLRRELRNGAVSGPPIQMPRVSS